MKSKMFIDTTKASSFLNNMTFKPEKMFKAFTAAQNGRSLYVSIEKIRELDPELAKKLESE